MIQELTPQADSPPMGLVDRVLPYLDPGFDPSRRLRGDDSWPRPYRRSTLSFAWQAAMLTLSGVVLILSIRSLPFQGDFNGDLYAAGFKVLHGLSPYNIPQLNHQAAVASATGATTSVTSPRWPMPVLLAAAPLSLLPVGIADILFFALCVGALIGGLRLLGVRDGRCVLVALVSAPAVVGIMVGNISTLMVLGLAVLWRVRTRVHLSAVSTAGLILGKLFLWPLGVWLLITRRYKTALLAFIWGAASFVIAFSVIGLNSLVRYPTILRDVATIGEARGCSLVALFMYMGAPVTTARTLALAMALMLLLLAGELARRPYGQAHGFGLVIVAALASTPVVWSHYLVVLFVPIALISPGFSWLWFLPGLAAFAPTDAHSSYGLSVLPILTAELGVALVLCEPLIPEPVLRYWRSIVATARAAAPS